MEKKKVLITGSEGSLGQALVKCLENEYELYGVDNFSRHGIIQRPRNYYFNCVDLADSNQVRLYKEATLSNNKNIQFDVIIHAAASLYGIKGYHKYRADILGNDSAMHANMLKYFNDAKRYVYISSSMVYEKCEKETFSEDDADNIVTPSTDYGLSKLIGERMVKAYHYQYNTPYTIWRPFNIITPFEESDREPGYSHVFSDFIKKIYIDKQDPVEIFGDGEQTRCFTYIDDVAKFIAEKSFIDETLNNTYNIGDERPIKIVDLAKMIWRKTRTTEKFNSVHTKIFQDDVRKRVPSCAKAKEMGWKVTKNLDEIIDICIKEAIDVEFKKG